MTDGNAPVAREYPVSEPVLWQFRSISGTWNACAPPKERDLEIFAGRYRPLYTAPQVTDPAQGAVSCGEPALWICLVAGGHPDGDVRVRAWTSKRERAEMFTAEGLDMQPFYAAPAGTIDWKMEAERLTDRLEIAHRIIAEYQASTIAGAKADVAAHGLPGERGRSMPDSGAWQPIETYDPRHELNVLVVDEGVVSEAYYNGESDAWFKEGKSEHDFDFVDSDRLFPTHWMPMPAPPSPVTSTEGK